MCLLYSNYSFQSPKKLIQIQAKKEVERSICFVLFFLLFCITNKAFSVIKELHTVAGSPTLTGYSHVVSQSNHRAKMIKNNKESVVMRGSIFRAAKLFVAVHTLTV